MASHEVQPVTAQQHIEGELNVLTMSKEQILNLISPTHLSNEENFDADSLLVVIEHECAKHYKKSYSENVFQENLEEKVSRDSFNPQLLCILKQLSSEMACKSPSVEVIMSILNKLSNHSWEAKLLMILAAYAYGLNHEDFLDILKNVPATLYCLEMSEINFAIFFRALETIKYFLHVKKVTKDEPALLSDVAGDHILEGVYWIIVTCTTHMCCLRSGEDKTQDLSPLIEKIGSIFSDLHSRIHTIEEMIARRKLKEIFARDAMHPLIDGSTNEQVSIDVLKEKNLLLFISGLTIDENDILKLMSIYDGKKNGDQYKIVWIPIVEQWTGNSLRKFKILKSKIKMPWYIVQSFSAVAGLKLIEDHRYDNGSIVLLMNPQGDVENKDALYLIQRLGINDFPPPKCQVVLESIYMRTPGPYDIEEYTFLYGGKDKQWIEQFSQMENVVVEDQLIQEVNILIKFSFVGRTSKDLKELGLDKEIQKLAGSFKNDSRWAMLIMTDDSKVISKDGTTILQVLEAFEKWKVNVRERGFQICFEEYHDRLLQTGSQPSASRNV